MSGAFLRSIRSFVYSAAMVLPLAVGLSGAGSATELKRVAADPGYDRRAAVNDVVVLDGTRSTSSLGTPLTYSWSVVSKPAGSQISLQSATAVRPSFTLDVAGDYVFRLTVTTDTSNDATVAGGTVSNGKVAICHIPPGNPANRHTIIVSSNAVQAHLGHGDQLGACGGTSGTATDFKEVRVSTIGVAPVAHAGLNRKVGTGVALLLDGSASFDADGNAITYAWSIVQKPTGSAAVLSSGTGVRPSITIDQQGTYVAELRVTDSTGKVSAPSRVVLSTRDVLAPKPSAGPAQVQAVGTTVRLDADGTFIPSGEARLSTWALLSRPGSSQAALSVAADARQSMPVDLAGDYVAQVTIPGASAVAAADDADDLLSESQGDPRFATVLVTSGRVPALAHAGSDQRITTPSTVTLDASKSTSLNGGLLTYTWSLLSKPSGSTAVLNNVNAVRPTFSADLAGTYVAQVIVSDMHGPSVPRTVVISTEAAAPVAVAGDDVRGQTNSSVTLASAGSTNPSGGPLTTTWSVLGLGDQTTGTLATPTAASTAFNIPAAGVMIQDAVLQAPVTVALTAAELAASPKNAMILASVGRITGATPRTIWRIRNPKTAADDATLSSVNGVFTRTVTVPAQSDVFIASSVTTGTADHRLVVGKKTISTLAAVSSAFADTRYASGGPSVKLSIIQLIAGNGLLERSDQVVVSTVEARSVARPTSAATTSLGVPVQLSGSASSNPNQAVTTAGLTYKWTLLSRPQFSTTVLANTTNVQATLTPDRYGLYVAQLIVSDGVLDSRPQTVVIEVVPRAPIAAATAPNSVDVGRVAALNGTGSNDPDGGALTYQWSFTSRPAGSQAAITNTTSATATFTPDVEGVYTAQLIVSNAFTSSAPASVSMTAVRRGLSFVSTIGAQTVALGSTLTFSIQATDPYSLPITYGIVGTIPPGATFDVNTGAFSFTPTTNVPNSYTVMFQATSSTGSATMTVPISITGSPPVGTSLSLKVYDAVDYANGILRPVSGAVATIAGTSATSTSSGDVALTGLSSAGLVSITVTGANAALAPDGRRYGDAISSATLIANVANTGSPVLLGRVSGGVTVTPGTPTVVTDPTLGVTITIAPNSATNPDGTPYTGSVTLGSLPPTTPVNLPPGFVPCQLLTIAPVGVTFNPPAQLTVQNRDQLPAGAVVDLWAFDLQLSTSRVVGIGKVSADGQTISMEVGGVPGGTVFSIAPRRTGIGLKKPQPTDVFVPNMLASGNMGATFSPPGSRQLNAARGLTFVYNSTTASARPVLSQTTKLGANNGVPLEITTKLTFAGVVQPTVLKTNMSTPLSGGPLDPGKSNAIVQAGIADATSLPSGVYPYEFLTLGRFGCSTVASQTTGSLVINNQSQSPFGPGWQLAELQKLTPSPNGTVAITEGTGRVLIAAPEQAPDFLPDPVYIPVPGPFRGGAADLQNSGKTDLVRLGWKDGKLHVILNKGNRQFVKSQVLDLGGQPATVKPDGSLQHDTSDIALGDINEDGMIDAVAVQAASQSAKLLFGGSGGTFQNQPLPIEGNEAGGYGTIGDWIGTGRNHPMISEGAGGYPDYHVIYNDGRGGYHWNHDAERLTGDPLAMTRVRLPGFAHDSLIGVTTANVVEFVYGGAVMDCGFSKMWSRGVGTDNPACGYYGNNALLQNARPADRLSLPTSPRLNNVGRIIAAEENDGSGRPIFAIAATNEVHIVEWLNPGANNQRIRQTLALPAGVSPQSVEFAALAKGNRPSLIVTAGIAGFYVFPNDGYGKFGAAVFIQTPFRVGVETNTVDLDGDGIADIALNDIDNDRVAIFFGKDNKTGAFVSPIGDYTRLVKNADGSFSRVYNDGSRVNFTPTGLQTAIVDANGNTTNYTYNGAGQLTQVVDPTGAVTSMTYSGAWLASTTDSAGRTTSFQRDAVGNPTSITDPEGNITQYLYDANNNLITTIDPKGAATTNAYTSTGQLKKQTYADGTSVRMDVSRQLGLDALGVDIGGPTNAKFVPEGQRVTVFQDAAGNLSETEVNEWGAVIRTTDALGRTSYFSRDNANRVVHTEVPAGMDTNPPAAAAPLRTMAPQVAAFSAPSATSAADPDPAQLSRPTVQPVTPSDSLTNELAWDAAGNMVSMREAVGRLYQPLSISLLERTTSYEYEPTRNRVTKKTDGDGYITTYAYDANGNQTSMTDALGNVTTYTYDSRGLRTSVTDARGNTTTFTYDASGNQRRITDALGTHFDTYYDANGNAILSIDAVGLPVERRNSATYDSLNRVKTTTSATGQLTQFGYDANGNVIRVTDPAGNISTREYDGLNRIVSETTPESGTATWTYDANGNLSRFVDAAGAATTHVYDVVNRRTGSVDATGATRGFAYDLRNNVSTYIDPKGTQSLFQFDILNRPFTRSQPFGGLRPYYFRFDRRDNMTGNSASHSEFEWQSVAYDALSRITFDGRGYRTYDAVGNLTTISNEYNWLYEVFTYDALNRKTSMVNPYRGIPVTLTYGYDALSRRMSMADSKGGTTSYTYDRADRLATITTPWGAVIEQTYDAAGRPLKLRYPNGLDADITFEAQTNRVASIQHRAGALAAPIAEHNHTFDIRGNLKALSELGTTKTYTYDQLERLVGVTRQVGPTGTPTADEAYSYDGEGNRVTSQSGASPAQTYVTDPSNRVLDDGLYTYTWTGHGALATKTPKAGGPTQTFTHSYESRNTQRLLRNVSNLPTGTGGLWQLDLFYDPFDRLATIRQVQPAGTTDDRIYDGEDMVFEIRDYHGVIGPQQWARYIHGPGSDQPLAMELYAPGAQPTPGTGQVFYYHADGEGSIRLLTNASGAIVNRYEYDSYGKRLQAVEAVRQPYTWKGREYIAGLDMYYNRMRFYDPQMGRFIQEDPIHFDGGDTNLFAFTWGNPVNWNDPSGLSPGIDYAAQLKMAAISGAASAIGAAVACKLYTLAAVIHQATEEPGSVLDADRPNCGVVALKAGVAGAIAGVSGPSGILFGRAKYMNQAGHKSGWFNRNRTFRVGWSWNQNGWRGPGNYFGVHGGKPGTPGHWHVTPIPGPRNKGIW